MPQIKMLTGDCREELKKLPEASVQMCLTSPPYWNLRDYGVAGQIGLEDTVDEYIDALLDVFDQVWRVLRPDGTLWLNLGDSYSSAGEKLKLWRPRTLSRARPRLTNEFKEKELLGIPWRTALAMQSEGWYLRGEIIWAKGVSFIPGYSGSVMPEPAHDRPVRAHEPLFLFTKRPRYYFDYIAVREQSIWRGKYNDPKWNETRRATNKLKHPTNNNAQGSGFSEWQPDDGRNLRDVWAISSASNPDGHFATFPARLVRPCVLAGSSSQACERCGAPYRRVLAERAVREYEAVPSIGIPGEHGKRGRRSGVLGFSDDTTTGWAQSCKCAGVSGAGESVVLDPFSGSGTVARVAVQHGRSAIGVELNPKYQAITEKRTAAVQMSFTE
jgi:DNA modification methylase